MDSTPYPTPLRLFVTTLALILIGACSDGDETSTKHRHAAKTKAAGEVSIDALPNDPPAEGSCLGWRRSLVQGSPHYSYSVYGCLRDMAREDWPKATAEAIQLVNWGIRPQPGSGLPSLLNTLSRFDSREAVRAYLVELKLLKSADAKDDEQDEWPPIAPADFLAQEGRAAWFDVETGSFPNEHHHLLARLASLATSRIRSATFTEVPPSDYHADDETYQLTAVLDGAEYHARAQNLGDWYDLGAVLELLNRIAVENTLPERFVSLPTGDQTATVLAIDTERLGVLVDAGLLELTESDQAMIHGKTAEQRAIEDLRAGGAKVILH